MICEECQKRKDARTSKQNRALHLYCGFIARELNELGIQYQYTGISGKTFELRYTPDLVKEYVWRPIQVALFKKKSTTRITTKEMNEIIDVLTLFFGERGVVLEFPSVESIENNKEL